MFYVPFTMNLDKDFWNKRYIDQTTGWDLGTISTPIKEYIDQIEDKSIKILIPGAGNSYEAEYLHNKGFKNICVLDISEEAISNFKNRVPSFPTENLINENFFAFEDQFDLVIEQTFFCALDPNLRESYIQHMHSILKSKGKLVGLLFNIDFGNDHPPFGGNIEEYKKSFSPFFSIKKMEEAYNSVAPRKGNELWINLIKKDL